MQRAENTQKAGNTQKIDNKQNVENTREKDNVFEIENIQDTELHLDRSIRELFEVPDVDIRTYSPLTLAYIGDTVFELIIRTVVVGKGNTHPERLHGQTSQIVRAKTQAKLVDVLLPQMTEEEADIYRRGHNAKSYSVSKNATLAEYRKATGFEALIGYLYLTDRFARAMELTRIGTQQLGLLE